jgi:hypothetical protein
MLLMQGNVRYKDVDEVKTNKVAPVVDHDDTFTFDPMISAQNRFITFKAEVIGRNLNIAEGEISESTSKSSSEEE